MQACGATVVTSSVIAPMDRADGAGFPRTPTPFQLRSLWPALLLLVLGLGALTAATAMPSGKDGQYAVIAPPWYALSDTIALIRRAHGDIARTGGPSNIIIAHATAPGFVRAAYGAGAWLVIDPMHVRGCAGFAPAAGDPHP